MTKLLLFRFFGRPMPGNGLLTEFHVCASRCLIEIKNKKNLRPLHQVIRTTICVQVSVAQRNCAVARF